MTKLLFNETPDGYEAEFRADRDFTIHMESGLPIDAVIYQTSVDDGRYAKRKVLIKVPNIYEEEVRCLVYPKMFKIVSKHAVQNCHVVFSNSSSSSSSPSSCCSEIDDLKIKLKEQENINAQQQEQIDNNTRVNDEQEVKIVDNTNLATPESVEDLFKK